MEAHGFNKTKEEYEEVMNSALKNMKERRRKREESMKNGIRTSIYDDTMQGQLGLREEPQERLTEKDSDEKGNISIKYKSRILQF